MTKWMLIGLFALALALYLFFQSSDPKLSNTIANTKNSEKITSQPSIEQAITRDRVEIPNEYTATIEPNLAPLFDQDQPITPEIAIKLMQQQIGTPDPRTPKLVKPNDGRRIKPTLEELNDPEKYALYQAEAQKRLNTGYVPSQQQINHISDRIKQAQNDGSRTSQEIQQAEEALEKLVQLKALLETQGVTEPTLNESD